MSAMAARLPVGHLHFAFFRSSVIAARAPPETKFLVGGMRQARSGIRCRASSGYGSTGTQPHLGWNCNQPALFAQLSRLCTYPSFVAQTGDLRAALIPNPNLSVEASMRGARMIVGLCIVILLVFTAVFSTGLQTRSAGSGSFTVSAGSGKILTFDGGDPVPRPNPAPSPTRS